MEREGQCVHQLVTSLSEKPALGNQLLNQPQFPTLTSLMGAYSALKTCQDMSRFAPTPTPPPMGSTTGSNDDVILLATPASTSARGCPNKRCVLFFTYCMKDTHLVELQSSPKTMATNTTWSQLWSYSVFKSTSS